MIINTVLTQILTSLECGLLRSFMRRTGVRVSMYWNFIIHQIFAEFLQPLLDFKTQRVAMFSLGFSFLGFLYFLLAWSISGSPDRSSTEIDSCTGEISLLLPPSRSRNLNFTYCRRRRWGWGRWWGMTLPSRKCLWSWWRSRGWTW